MEKEYLEYLIKGLVQYPDQVRIEKTIDNMGILLSLSVSKNDMGVVIGKRGVTASAIKLLSKLNGFKNEQRISVKIQEPQI